MLVSKVRLLTLHIRSFRRSALIMDYKRQASNTSSSDAPTTPTSPTSPASPTPVDHDTMVALCKSVIPPLTYSRHKGEAGRIGVIGGCEEYTGAPYYAALSSLKVGADLSHVFCTSSAGTAIKSYNPDLIVHPLLDRPNAVDEVVKWLPRLHALVIGPGLGRDEQTLTAAKGIMARAKRMRIPMVLDADAIHLIIQEPEVIKDFSLATLTPNVVEFSRLYQQVMGQKPEEGSDVTATIELSKALGNVTIVRKGPSDVICMGDKVVTCGVEGSPRRCGGQGDVLAGSMGTFLHWAHAAAKTTDSYLLKTQGPNITAAYAACALTRDCNRRAFSKHRRSTTTTDMLVEIQAAFEALFEPRDD